MIISEAEKIMSLGDPLNANMNKMTNPGNSTGDALVMAREKGGFVKKGAAPKAAKNIEEVEDTIDVDIFLNDPEITSLNMYDKELDPHYLVDKYLKEYFAYFNINNSIVDFIVWGTDGEVIYSWKN
jgi:hypothetical protein